MDEFNKALIGFIVLFLISGLFTSYKAIEARNNGRNIVRAIVPFIIAEMFLIASFLIWFFKNAY